jgi:hypothetical protein
MNERARRSRVIWRDQGLDQWWPAGDRASEKLANAGAAEARIDGLFVAGC